MNNCSFLGFGLGLRSQHHAHIIEHRPPIDWFEVITEDFIGQGGPDFSSLMQIREHYPLVMHGVSLSLGGTDPLNQIYLKQLKALADLIEPCWISDHLCWTGVNGVNTHDLLPLPYTEEALKHLVSRIQQAQDYLGRQILVENVSSYVSYKQSEMTEWEFLARLAQEVDCLLLCDVNNIYVSAKNHGFDASKYLQALPKQRVQQIHLAGHTQRDSVIIDTHDAEIIDPVWQLYREAITCFGPVSTMIERDDNIPAFDALVAELQIAKAIHSEVASTQQLEAEVML